MLSSKRRNAFSTCQVSWTHNVRRLAARVLTCLVFSWVVSSSASAQSYLFNEVGFTPPPSTSTFSTIAIQDNPPEEYVSRPGSRILARAVMLPIPTSSRPADPRAPVRPLSVKWSGGKVSIEAEGVPLSELLAMVSRQTGIGIAGAQGLNEGVFVDFASIDLRQALQNLLNHNDYAIMEGPSGSAFPSGARAIVFGRSSDTRSVMPPAQVETIDPGVAATDPEMNPGVVEAVARSGDREALRRYLGDANPSIQAEAFDALATSDKDAAVAGLVAELKDSDQSLKRFQTLQILDQSGNADEQTVMEVLRDALKDPDPSTSAYAVQSLARRGGADAVDALSEAFHSADPTMRLTVLEGVAQTQAGLPLLREGLADRDEAVRSSAATLLRQAEAGTGPTGQQ